jgi:hypothetical protein
MALGISGVVAETPVHISDEQSNRGTAMKKLLLPLAAAAVVAGLWAAPVASADEDTYIADLAHDGFTGPRDTALKFGYAVCADIQHQVPRATTVQAIYDNTGQSIGARDANYIYDAAAIHLCTG